MFENFIAAIRALFARPVFARYGVNYRGSEIGANNLTVHYGEHGTHSIIRDTDSSDVVIYSRNGKIIDALPANRDTQIRYSRF